MKDIRPELLDELLSGYGKPSDLLGEDGILVAEEALIRSAASDG